MAPPNPKIKIAPGVYVRVFNIFAKKIGYAKIDHWLKKEDVALLDRQVGMYWTYPLKQLELCPPADIPGLVQADLKERRENGN